MAINATGLNQLSNAQAERIAVVALSGGMDSTSLLMHLLSRGYRVHGLSFDYGQKHSLEIERLKANLEYFREHNLVVDWRMVDLTSVGPLMYSALTTENWNVPTGHYEQENMKETFVPNRNAIFASICYSWSLSLAMRRSPQSTEPIKFGLGVHSGDHAIYPDCRPEFYQALMAAFELGNWGAQNVTLYLPYLHADKFEILKDAHSSIENLGLDFQRVFRNTLTSYSPNAAGESAGLTGSDVERILAFHRLGIPDPLPYLKPWEDVVAQALQFESLHKP